MTGFENRAGLTVSSSKMQLVEIVYKNGRFNLGNVDEAYFNESINFEKDKDTKIISIIQSAFNELLIKNKLKSKSVSFALPFELFYIIQVPYHNTLLHQDLEEELRWEFSVLYPFTPTKDLSIQYIEVEKNNLINFNSVIAVAIQRKFITLFQNFCSDNNLKLDFIDNIHTASERALTVNLPDAAKGLNLSIYFCNKFLSLLFTLNGKPVQFKLIPLNDAGEIPSILLTETSPQESFGINRNLIDQVFISGEEISNTIIKALENTLVVPISNFNPFEKIKPVPELIENRYYSEKFNSFSSAAGIALRIA